MDYVKCWDAFLSASLMAVKGQTGHSRGKSTGICEKREKQYLFFKQSL